MYQQAKIVDKRPAVLRREQKEAILEKLIPIDNGIVTKRNSNRSQKIASCTTEKVQTASSDSPRYLLDRAKHSIQYRYKHATVLFYLHALQEPYIVGLVFDIFFW